MQFPLAQIQGAIGAQFIEFGLDAEARGTCVRGWSIDSRTVDRGDLFFAIRGEYFDGHAFVNAAFERGALAAVVSEDLGGAQGPRFKVPDTLAALQGLASWARSRWHKTVVAVTGSAGKTSTKDMIAELLSVRLRVGKTGGNLNNQSWTSAVAAASPRGGRSCSARDGHESCGRNSSTRRHRAAAKSV